MKTRTRRSKETFIPNSRWATYAAAGAATTLAGISAAEAEIHSNMVGRSEAFGLPRNQFRLVDYAYGDPGDRVRAGEKSGGHTSTLESLGTLALYPAR
jgi:hypothetical protein